jgi:hypothetical protein
MNRQNTVRSKWLPAAVMLLTLLAGTAGAATFDLCTGTVNLVMPDGASVPAWGFGTMAGGVCTGVKVPGPELTVAWNDPVLAINLTNNLAEPVSLHITGQQLSNNTGPAAVGGRVMSFSHETAPGGTASYQWNNFKPGTYLLSSGTNPAKQVQMGLFLAVKKDTALNLAYEFVPYNSQVTMVFHEVDPEIQAAIAAGDYGTPTSTFPSSIHRQPRYFLINGKAFPQIPDPLVQTNLNQRLLIRFLNAGLETHVPSILGAYLTTVAEDGIKYKYPKEEYGFEMAAGKTVDAIFVATAPGPVPSRKYPIYDARLRLSNKGTYAGATPGGGMLAYVRVR